MVRQLRALGPGAWCPENDGAYQAEMAELHRKRQTTPLEKVEQAKLILDDVVCGRGMFGVDPAADLAWAIKEVTKAQALLHP